MSSNYHSMSNKELLDRVEQGEMRTNFTLYVEFMRRMDEQGTSYENTVEDIERWKADTTASIEKSNEHNQKCLEVKAEVGFRLSTTIPSSLCGIEKTS